MKQKLNNTYCATPISYSDLTKTHPILQNYLGYLLHRLTIIFKAQMDSEIHHLSIQGPQFAVLLIIFESPETTLNQISLESGIDKASLVKIIDHLVSEKLVTREESKSDRRNKLLKITELGKKTALKATQIRKKFEDKFLKSLSEKDSQHLKETLLHLININTNKQK